MMTSGPQPCKQETGAWEASSLGGRDEDMTMIEPEFDLFVIGGGVNGCGIARDAAGRGLKVGLAEKDDLASATSSASTKLFHGGLRYLEHFEFRLVREGLAEREMLLRAMPHISWPMRFVLPCHRDMRFEGTTPASRVLTRIMPWMKGRRPDWLIRLGLFLYDSIGERSILPGTATLDLASNREGDPLRTRFRKAFEYSDCWVDDSRLVTLNARDAAERGAEINVRTRVVGARRVGKCWEIQTEEKTYGERRTRTARLLVNAAGPWAGEVLSGVIAARTPAALRLVRGSHIVTRRLYDHDKCYFLQGEDGRIAFMIPYESDFTLIGTTDVDCGTAMQRPVCTDDERDYLIAFVNRYFRMQISARDVVWSFAGVRALFDSGEENATATTREYVLEWDDSDGAPLLSVLGGKITTYRRLAERALHGMERYFPGLPGPWTAGAALPGGGFGFDQVESLERELRQRFDFLDGFWARRLVRAYGTDAAQILGNSSDVADLGRSFGATLTEREVDWMMEKEFARTAEDVVWRRSKLGLRMKTGEVAALDGYVRSRLPG